MRKRVILLCAALLIPLTLSAVSLDEIVSSAMMASPSYRNAEISYQNGLLDLGSRNLEDKTVVSVSADVNPLAKSIGGIGVSLKDGEYGITASPAVTVTLPNGTTKIQGGLSYGMDYKNNYNIVAPSAGVSHTFDFTGYDSEIAEELSYSKQDMSLNLSYQKSVISFRKTIISTISQLLSLESSLSSSRSSLEKSRKSFDDINKLGTLSPSSAMYKNQENLLVSAENSLKSLEAQYENAKINYKDLTGLDWTGIDEIEKPVLELRVLEQGNTEVYLKALDISIAEEQYNSSYAKLNPQSLAVGANASGTYLSDNRNALSSGSLSISGSASYSQSTWSVSAKPGVSISFPSSGDAKATPSLTISGYWTNGSTAQSDESMDITLTTLRNAIVSAENSYLSALTSYMQEGQSLNLKIMQWEYKCSQAISEMDYLKSALETQKELFALGLVAEDKVDDAQAKVDSASDEYLILMLEGKALECDIASFAL